MKKLLTTTVAAFAFATTACASYGEAYSAADTAATTGTVAAEGEVDPAIWKLTDEDTTIYLLGTYHMLPEDLEWQTDTIQSALAASEEVYFEIPDDLSDPTALMPIIQSIAITPGQPSLAERIGEENAAKAAAFLEGSGIPPQALNVMDSWFVALTLANVGAMKLGFTGENGAEMVLREVAESRELPIKGLESVEEQLGHLDRMSADTQNEFLRVTVEELDNFEEGFQELLTVWKRGDGEGMAAIFDEQMAIGTEQRLSLLTNRNTDWTGDIVERMGQPGTVFVAVGAGHLVGDDSVIAMLAEQGYVATRIDD